MNSNLIVLMIDIRENVHCEWLVFLFHYFGKCLVVTLQFMAKKKAKVKAKWSVSGQFFYVIIDKSGSINVNKP